MRTLPRCARNLRHHPHPRLRASLNFGPRLSTAQSCWLIWPSRFGATSSSAIEALTAAVLFAAMCWIHNAVATHSPILGVTSSDPDSGKSTLLAILELLVPKPFRSAELTGAAAFRTIDREHPTMIVDEADDIFSAQ